MTGYDSENLSLRFSIVAAARQAQIVFGLYRVTLLQHGIAVSVIRFVIALLEIQCLAEGFRSLAGIGFD